MKTCGRCKTEKSLDDFHRNAGSRDGRTSQCKECAKERSREWNRKNKDRANAKSREWQREHRDHRKRYMKDYYAEHRETLITANVKWNRDHPDVVKAINSEYRKRVREDRTVKLKQVIKTAQVNAIKRGFECDMTFELLDTYIKIQDEKCALTGWTFDYSVDEKYHFRPLGPSIDRIKSDKGYTFDNIQIVCAMVNRAKNECSQELFDSMCRARVERIDAA